MQAKKKIVFVVNTVGMTGGIRVIFEYAKRFKADGFDVQIIHLLKLKPGVIGLIVAMLKKIKWLIIGDNKISWFNLAGVPVLHRMSLNNVKADILIASAYETAKPVSNAKTNAEKYYFVQGYESWGGKAADETYNLPLKKIVISTFVANIIKQKLNASVYAIATQGIELDKFNVNDKKFNKNKIISMLYHTLGVKGTKIGLKALDLIAKKHPEVKFSLFGMYQPENLPKNSTYTLNPSREELKKLYANADILISPSLAEGFSLVPMEAMAASCAVVATKVGGIMDHSKDGVSAVWVEPGSATALARAAIDLIENAEKLQRIAKAGHEQIQNFSIENAYQNFKSLILN